MTELYELPTGYAGPTNVEAVPRHIGFERIESDVPGPVHGNIARVIEGFADNPIGETIEAGLNINTMSDEEVEELPLEDEPPADYV